MRFPIETGLWRKFNRKERLCTKCTKGVIDDKFHYLFICSNYQIVELRKLLYS